MMAAKRSDAGKRTALDKGLRGMFKALESRPTPDRIRSVVDQLEEPAIPQKKQAEG